MKPDAYDRRNLQQVLEGLRRIAELDRDTTYADSGTGYARALGTANGIAKGILPYLETVLGVK